MKKKQFVVFALMFAVAWMYQPAAFAAADVPLDRALFTLTDYIKIVARVIVTIMVAVTGTMVLFDAGSANAVKLARIVLGVGLTLGVADFIVSENGIFKELFRVISGNVDKPIPPVISFGGDDKGLNFIGQFVTYYEQVCIYGAAMLIPTALKWLAALVIIDMTVTLMFKLEGDHIQYMLQQILRIGFFIFLIQCWIGGSGAISNIANLIFTSFEQIGINAAGMTLLKPENILVNGFTVVTTVMDGLSGNFLKGDIFLAIVQIIIAIAAFICVAITSLELIMCRLEFWTISMIVVPLIPLGIYQHTRFLFERAIGAIFNLGIKMAMVTFICIVTGPILSAMVKVFSESNGLVSNVVSLLMVFFGTLVIAVLARKAPALASGLFNGQPSLGGSSMTGMAVGAAMMAAKGAGTVVQASNMAGGATALNTIAKNGGRPTNFGMRQLGTAMNLAKIANQAYNPLSRGYNEAQASIRTRMERNRGNSDMQSMGSQIRKDNDGNITAGWKPTQTANEQNQHISQEINELKKMFETRFSEPSPKSSGLKDSTIKNK